MKITIDVKENENSKINVTINKLKKNKNTKDSEYNASINVYNAICKALKEISE